MSTIVEVHRRRVVAARYFLLGKGYHKALKALEVVRNVEEGKTRKDGLTPNFHHQLTVVQYIMSLQDGLMFPEATITVAFLHDLHEDHSDQWPRERIQDMFGAEIEQAVWKLSKKTGGLTKNAPSYFHDMTECPLASVVKLADRIHNIQTMQGVFSPEKQDAYIREVDQWFIPMAKKARYLYPEQFGVYENLKWTLRAQCDLVRASLEATHGSDVHS